MTGVFNPEMDRRTMLQTIAIGAAAATLPPSAEAVPAATTTNTDAIGAPLPRAEGALKVAGKATYAIEHPVENIAYGVMVQSTIAAGRVIKVHDEDARRAPGVLAIYSVANPLPLGRSEVFSKGGAATENFLPFQDDRVLWNGQHVAFVVAETFEQATEAATLVRIDYEEAVPVLDAGAVDAPRLRQEKMDIAWGDAEQAMATAAIRIEGEYSTPREYNVPIEPHACIAAWAGQELTVWEPSQWVSGARGIIADWMRVPTDKVRVISPYVGGAFGCKVSPHPHVAVTCAAARVLGRPVKTALTRPQTFTGYGGRPHTHQRIAIGADRNGKIQSIIHEGWNETAAEDTHVEPTNAVTPIMYATPNFRSSHSLAPVNTVNPGWLRAPGENVSTYALETAIDELAYAVEVDPLEIRLRNYADHDHQAKLPWSTRRLREAYRAGADAFGWEKRTLEPRSMRAGRELIGWGMASGTYPVRRSPGDASVTVLANGTIEVRSAGIDMGTGTYTILAQAAADVLGVPTTRVTVKLGDTELPAAPLAGGSQLANLLMGAVDKAARACADRLKALASEDPRSPLNGVPANAIALAEGRLKPVRRPGDGITMTALLKATGSQSVTARADTFKPGATQEDRRIVAETFKGMIEPTANGVSAHAWSAHFVEVRVDEDFGTVRVRRMIGAFDSGRVYNPRLARSQWMGGMIMGLGQALLEDGVFDVHTGRVVSASLADYLVAVNADVPEITTISVGEPDFAATRLGGKAVGELGIVGVAAAIGNAVYHATGKRVRDLPITMEKLLV